MHEDRESDRAIPGHIRGARAELAIAGLASLQHGVVARHQLVAEGLTSWMVDDRIASRRLVPLHRGVYAVGHARLRREGVWLAAVLAVGREAALSHRDAATLHEIRYSNGTVVDVSTPMERRGQRGIRIHGRSALDARDITVIDSIPVTTVARTLVDLAGVVPRDQLAKAVSEAERRRTIDVVAIEHVLSRVRGRRGPGIAKLRAVLAAHAALGVTLTRSELEDRFVALLDAQCIPRPRLNAWIAEVGLEVDALWPAERLVVELDGYAFHHDRRTFERDRQKANDLVDLGYRVLRFTHRHVVDEPGDVAIRLRRALYPSAWIRSTASAMRSSGAVRAMRKKPSPDAP